jgi:hypothetical protein
MTDRISFPPLRDLPPGHHAARKQHLLGEIAHVRARPPLPAVQPPGRRRSWKSVAAVAIAVPMLMGAVGVGIAAALGAFNGIAVVQHPQTTSDVLDPATAAYVTAHLVGVQLDTTRLIGRLPSGQKVYVITGSQDDLCTVLEPPNPTAWCGAPLSTDHPATLYTYPTGDPAAPWVDFGVALDGVGSVTFTPAEAADGSPEGSSVTVPVTDNLWLYPGQRMVNALQPVTAHFEDGTTVTEPATGANCAAC